MSLKICYMSRISHLLFLLWCLTPMQGIAQLRVATYQYAGNSRENNIRPAANVVAAAIGQTAKVASYAGVRELVDAIQRDEVDLAFINTFGYLLLAADSAAATGMPPLVVWQPPTGGVGDNYRCIFIAPQGGLIADSADIVRYASELSLLLVSEGSTSGNLVPRMALSALGIAYPEQQFKTVVYGGTHQAAAGQVAMGKADLGAIGSIAYADFVRDTTNRPIRLVWKSPEIPLGPVLVSSRFSDPEREQMAAAFTNLHRSHPAAFEAAKQGWSEAQHVQTYQRVPADYLDRLMPQFGDIAELKRILAKFLTGG